MAPYVEYAYKGRRFVLRTLARKLRERGITGASTSNLTGIFKGRHNPRYELLLGMAEILQMPLDEVKALIDTCREQSKEHYNNPPPNLIED